MSKDDAIARFVYKTSPPTYQSARFTDWIRPYLQTQQVETEKSGSYNSYFKNKYEAVLKSLTYLTRYEEKVKLFQEEELAAYEKAKQLHPEEVADLEKDWRAYNNTDVIKHWPPQLIIGRQVADDKEWLVYDENPNVKVTIIEVGCEYNYSNPTGFFNISLPHIEAKTTMYQTMSYQTFKRINLEAERQKKIKDQLDEQTDSAKDTIKPKAEVQASASLGGVTGTKVGVSAGG